MRPLHNALRISILIVASLGIATAAQARPTLYTASLILHSFANDAAGELQVLPLGKKCNPNVGGGTTCGSTTLHYGAPLIGSGKADVILSKSQPLNFKLVQSQLTARARGSLPPYPGISFTRTTADLVNARGDFGIGKGHGSFSFTPRLGSGSTRVRVIAGKQKFGGVMQLMGSFGTKIAGSTSGGGKWKGDFPTWGVDVIGGSYAKTAKISGVISFTSQMLTYPSVAVVTGFPWTTGEVSVEAAGGSGHQTKLVRNGYDNRTSRGFGTIQMVAPRLTHWSGGSHWGDVAILKVKFVPEPKGWLMLVAGVSLLGTTHYLRPRAN